MEKKNAVLRPAGGFCRIGDAVSYTIKKAATPELPTWEVVVVDNLL